MYSGNNIAKKKSKSKTKKQTSITPKIQDSRKSAKEKIEQ